MRSFLPKEGDRFRLKKGRHIRGSVKDRYAQYGEGGVCAASNMARVDRLEPVDQARVDGLEPVDEARVDGLEPVDQAGSIA